MWRASVLTIFPEMFPGPLGVSLAGKALAAGIWALDAVDIRSHAPDRHRTVDDTPAGGGPGMVMKADVLARARRRRGAAGRRPAAPADEPARRAADAGAGRERWRRARRGRSCAAGSRAWTSASSRPRNFEEVSLGDYVLSGGEIAALALLDACVRLFRASWARRPPARRKASAKACSNIRNTPGPSSSRATPSRRC